MFQMKHRAGTPKAQKRMATVSIIITPYVLFELLQWMQKAPCRALERE